MSPETLAQSSLLWGLIAAQIAMGGFDIIVHHELTERLAWRSNAAQELRLHAARNAIYALLFCALAWLRPQGLVAGTVIAFLVAEIAITLWDFVEEDQTRRLPATERVLHTLLAINYGAIMAIAVPVLVDWAGEPTGVVLVDYGIGSLILSVASIGCLGFALRDLSTSRRAARLVEPPAPRLDSLEGKSRCVLVTGATGFVGSRLTEALVAGGHEVIALVRDSRRAGHLPTPVTLVGDPEQIASDRTVDAVVHLAGEPVAAWPWTRRQRFAILKSRIATARQLRAWAASRPADMRPSVIIAASAVGFYGERGEESLTEADGAGEGFAARVCRAVEREAAASRCLGMRVVSLRIGLVLSIRGGPLGAMVPAFDLGLGGPLGSGRQWTSWIARDDLVRLIAHAIASPEIEGAVNATAPKPVRGKELASALGRALRRPVLFRVPAWLLRGGLGALADEVLLASQRVFPVKASASGFVFDRPTIEDALHHELRPAGNGVREGRGATRHAAAAAGNR